MRITHVSEIRAGIALLLVGIRDADTVVNAVRDSVSVGVLLPGVRPRIDEVTRVAVVAVVARVHISHSRVPVGLIGVGVTGAVVPSITDAIAVAVPLAGVGNERTIIQVVWHSVSVRVVSNGDGVLLARPGYPHAAAATAAAASSLLVRSTARHAQT